MFQINRIMLNFVVVLITFGVANGAFLPYGGVPYGVGLGNGLYGGAHYGIGSPFNGHSGFSNDLSHYSGDGRHYGNINSNGLLHHSLGSAGAMANGGGHGYTGGQRYANGQQGLGGFNSNAYGGDFNNRGGGFSHGNGYFDAAGRGNVGGFANSGHNKGHKTTGFHKSYHNVENGRDTKYVDEDHDTGAENFGKEFGNNFANGFGSGFNGAGGNGQYGANRYVDQAGGHGQSGGSFDDAHYGGHGANNYYNGQDLALRDSHLANNHNNFGQGYYGMGSRHGMGMNYFPHAW